VSPQALPENPEEADQRKKKEEETLKDLESIDIKSGDYIVHIHIIEARDLKAENLDGKIIYFIFLFSV